MNQKREKENNVTDNYFVAEKTREFNYYSAKQDRNHVQSSFFIFINSVYEEYYEIRLFFINRRQDVDDASQNNESHSQKQFK